MRFILAVAIRAFTIGLIGASISLLTSLLNGVGFIGGWKIALAVLLVMSTIVVIALVKQTWDEFAWLKANGYKITELTHEDYFHAMQQMEEDSHPK
jgi:ABC-type multidrug transport system fused ATPase/permease subunit